VIHGALEAMDRLHHLVDYRIEKLPCFLRVSVSKEFHRPLQVGKQNRDLLALAFERGFRS